MPELYYIQDTRKCVGNSALWWKENGYGYTSDLRQAWKVEWKAETFRFASLRDTDVLRKCSDMDALAEMHVDVQQIGKPTPPPPAMRTTRPVFHPDEEPES